MLCLNRKGDKKMEKGEKEKMEKKELYGISITRKIKMKGHLGPGYEVVDRIIEGKRKAFSYYRMKCLTLSTFEVVIFNMNDGMPIQRHFRKWIVAKRIPNNFKCSALS